MKRITKDSNVQDVLKNIGVGPGEELRESSKREVSLEKFAQLRSRNPQTTLTIKESPTAFVEVEEGDEVEEFRNITVTSKKFEQQYSDMEADYHDYLLQKAFTAHEVGHILYSDYEALQHFTDKVKQEESDKEGVDEKQVGRYEQMFHSLYNVLEDGAIEKYLAEDFRLDEELLHLRATIHEDTYMGKKVPKADGDDEYHYPFFFAVITACLNHAVYDNGETRKLIDEDDDRHIFAIQGAKIDRDMFIKDCLPQIQSAVPDILNETDAYSRAEKIYDLWQDIRKYLDRSTTSGAFEWSKQKKNRKSDSYVEGVPENLSESHGNQKKEHNQSPGSESEQSQGKERGDRIKTSHEKEGVGKEKAEQGIVEETKQESGDWSDEIEEIIESLGAGEGVEEIAIAEDNDVNQERKNQAKQQAKRTSRLFERRLRQMKKNKTIENKQRGDFNSRALINAERGSTRVFKQTKEGDVKNYNCMIVLDRSGSMGGKVEDVELAAGSIAWGLEDNGVDVSIIDTENSQTTLSKPFGTKTENFEEKVLGGRCSGGTPLTGTMKFARQRMERGDNDIPFAIVVTDGKPRSEASFKEQIRQANFPVLGLYLTNKDASDQLSLYDKAVTCSTDDDLNERLMNLINSIMF